jgi:hypothetical protein
MMNVKRETYFHTYYCITDNECKEGDMLFLLSLYHQIFLIIKGSIMFFLSNSLCIDTFSLNCGFELIDFESKDN